MLGAVFCFKMYYINNICFICLNSNITLSAVFHKQTHTEVQYVLPELTILNPANPVFICSSCHTTLRSYSTFKKKCLDNYSRLNDYIKILQGCNATLDQSFNELQIRVINCEQLIKQENDNQLYIEEKKEDTLMSREEHHDLKTELDDIKKESPEYEDSTDRNFYQQLVKSESVSDDIQDCGSSVLIEGNKALDNQNYQKTVVEDYIVVEDKFASQELFVFKSNNQDENEDALFPRAAHNYSNIVIDNDNVLDKQNYRQTVVEELVSQEFFVVKINNQDENEDTLLPSEEQDDCNIVAENNIDVEKESLTFEEVVDRELSQKLVCTPSESVSDDEQDGGSNSNTETNCQEFYCSICKEMFTDRLTFDSHLRNHISNITGLDCIICDKKFRKKRNLLYHMKLHLGIKDYECSTCKQKFISIATLKRHMNVHKSVKNYECSICKKKFTYNCSLNLHIKRHEGRKDFECSICKKKFLLNYQLKLHIKMHDYECSFCKKKFSYNCALKIHIKLHKSRKYYECSICKKKFLHNSSLKIHIKTHEGRKDYECAICKQKFSQNSHLNIHIKTHEGRKDYECSICKKKFTRNYSLRKHMKIHEKPQ